MSPKDTTTTANEESANLDDAPEETVTSTDTPLDTQDMTAVEDTPKGQVEPSSQSALEKQAKEYLDGWQRERSEFANYKRRMEREMKDIAAYATAGAFLSLLPIIDDFERAFANVPEELAGNAWMEGVTGIHRKFQKILDDQGITVIDPVGQPFDPTQHEAVGTEDSDTVESGHVATTLQKGYIRGDKVLRPALVRVAS